MGARGVSSVAIAAVIGVLGFAASASAATRPVVVSPQPRASIHGNTVRIVIRSGDEYGDLSVKLNGRQIGLDFAPGKRGLRTLQASVSHGLRRGRNVLSVRARRGVKTRRATVRFSVRRSAPLVGAGRDDLVTVGTSVPIQSRVVRAAAGRQTGSPRFSVVHAPRGSKVRKLAKLTPARPAGSRAAIRAATLPLTPLRPALNPDVPGPYTVRVTVGTGRSAVTDEVTHDARPKDPLVPVDLKPNDNEQPEIRIADTTYPAPYLGSDGPGKGLYSVPERGWVAEWHVIAVSRKDTRVLWDRTYGRCVIGDAYQDCRAPDDADPGKAYAPVQVDSAAETAALAPGKGHAGALIIANSLAHADGNADEMGFLKDIGYAYKARGYEFQPHFFHSVIGVPGMKPGEADMSTATNRSTGKNLYWLRGFLTPDQNYKYHFLRGARLHFDTRSAQSCTTLPAQCTVSQTVDGHTVSGTAPTGRGGYLVSGWDPETLEPRGSSFLTIDNNSASSHDGTTNMLTFVRKLRDDGRVIVITTLHTPGMDPGTLIGAPAEKWNAITDLIASIGGTKNGFLRSVSTPFTAYTLIGWGGAGENGADEAGGPGDPARLRGALLTDNSGYFIRPANVSSVGPPAERINEMMVTPTRSDWKYPDASTPEGATIQCIGAHLGKGIDIRATYRELLTASDATDLHDDVADTKLNQLAPVPEASLTCTPTQQQFDDAKGQLLTELGWVANVRGYLTALTAPATAKGDLVFGQALTLGNKLKEALDEEEQQQAVTAAALGFVATLLDLIAPGVGSFVKDAEKISHALEATAGAFELAARGVERDADGSESDDPRVAAVELAAELQLKAASTVAAFTQIGDVIVADPNKLAEVGLNQHCTPNTVGGCREGMEEYAANGDELAELTDVALRAMGRELYSTLIPKMYTTWDTGLTAFPDDPYAHFYCTGTSSPFGKVPATQYAASLERVNYGQPNVSRVYLSIRSATTWHWIPEEITERMFGPTGDTWETGGLGMDRLAYLRDMPERFEPGSYSCSFDK
jgi:hypothetical protein